MYTQRFSEYSDLLARIDPASYSGEQNSGRVSLANYRRAAIVLSVGAIGTSATLDLQLEQADAASGGTLKDVTGKLITQLTDSPDDDNKVVIIEVRSEELDTSNGFEYINVEVTGANAATIYGLLVFGLEPRFAPVSVANVEEVVD